MPEELLFRKDEIKNSSSITRLVLSRYEASVNNLRLYTSINSKCTDYMQIEQNVRIDTRLNVFAVGLVPGQLS